jgi:hypothetical protein
VINFENLGYFLKAINPQGLTNLDFVKYSSSIRAHHPPLAGAYTPTNSKNLQALAPPLRGSGF